MNNETLLKSFIEEVWNNKNFDAVEQYVDDEYTVSIDTDDPWEGMVLNNQEYKKRLHYSFDSFPDMHFDIQSAIEDGDFVAITWVLTGTNLGKIGELPPTGKKIKANGVTVYQINNGKVAGHSQVFDRNTVAKQLGIT
jgi:steroid delta-isomerase-like uncharacterized protein